MVMLDKLNLVMVAAVAEEAVVPLVDQEEVLVKIIVMVVAVVMAQVQNM
tara:strand:+ start:402 stop:548 length:147 start_codon:yes stop_codon:yes gene_type:complete